MRSMELSIALSGAFDTEIGPCDLTKIPKQQPARATRATLVRPRRAVRRASESLSARPVTAAAYQ